MIGKEIILKRRVRELEKALRPFARFTHEPDGMKRAQGDIFVPTQGDVWFYVGHNAEGHRPHLHTDAFATARRLLR